MLADCRFDVQRHSILTGRLDDSLTALYLREHPVNVWSSGIAALNRPGNAPPASTRMFVDLATLRRTAFHADILKPQGIVDQVFTEHASLQQGGNTGGISVTINERQSQNCDVIARRLGVLQAHISCAIDLFVELADHRRRRLEAQALIDALPDASLLIDGDQRILAANDAAELVLRAGDGITATTTAVPRLMLTSLNEGRQFARLTARALSAISDAEDDFKPTLRVTRPSGRAAYLLIATPLPSVALSVWDMDAPARLLVRILDPALRSETAGARLRAAFGLTRSETRVAAMIASGMSTPQVAASLGVSVNTVRTQLAHIFDKTGTRSQTALARLAALLGD